MRSVALVRRPFSVPYCAFVILINFALYNCHYINIIISCGKLRSVGIVSNRLHHGGWSYHFGASLGECRCYLPGCYCILDIWKVADWLHPRKYSVLLIFILSCIYVGI